MKVLVVGGGGREHAIIRKLKESPRISALYALPGNGGIEKDAVCVPIDAKDIAAIVRFARENRIDFAVIAPDDPLVLGAVDALNAVGIPCFGPKANAAILEGSKAFAKRLMQQYNIPTAAFSICESPEQAMQMLETIPYPTVIKADGLALGKGVIIAQTKAEAKAAIHAIMEERIFGNSGSSIVVEEFLSGPEVSVLCFTDGKCIKPMVSSMDHKRIGENDTGLNTGGMGTIAPNPYYTEDIAERCMQEIFLPTIRAMEKEGRPFCGCLYFGLMLTAQGPKVIEYNCRFGDPETQVVLPLLKSDLLDIMMATANGTLSETPVVFSDEAAACVIMASDGYPQKYQTGCPIRLPDTLKSGEAIFIAGAKQKDGQLITAGGRVLGAAAVGDTLRDAIANAYAIVDKIAFDNAVYRRDIGAKALAKGE